MLTRDRPEFARKAVECFRAQTYLDVAPCGLIVLDTGEGSERLKDTDDEVKTMWLPELRGRTIGALRNYVPGHLETPDVYLHWDDDDYSHPNRIAEQVALLQSSGAEVVGYNELLFERFGEAWLFSRTSGSYAVGASLCYWRKTWEKRKFRDISQSEDWHFIQELNVCAVSAQVRASNRAPVEPRLIQRIHGRNSSNSYAELKPPSWKRVPEWDSRMRSILGTP
jgi:hypothetical protein